MSPQLFANLVKVIDKWIERNTEDDEWPSVIISPDTVILMAKASESVLDAVVNSQKYAIDQGYFKTK